MRTVDPQKTAERRRQILDAALICFRRSGFHGTSMASICKQANMSPGHLYHYFKGKEDLIEAFVEEDKKKTEKKLEILLKSEDTLESIIAVINEVYSPDVNIWGALNAEITAEASRNERIEQILQQRNILFQQNLENLIRTAQSKGHINSVIDPTGFSHTFLGLAHGISILFDRIPAPHLEQTKRTTSLMLKKFLNPNEAT